AFVNGSQVGYDHKLESGDNLEFVQKKGRKGGIQDCWSWNHKLIFKSSKRMFVHRATKKWNLLKQVELNWVLYLLYFGGETILFVGQACRCFRAQFPAQPEKIGLIANPVCVHP
ncbi:MAG TPA: hypothetical protein DDZ51_01395, partial [Planctomycetaceae bacterium]|nr:hypothetical protein [Planctomycetaceae bacterium]